MTDNATSVLSRGYLDEFVSNANEVVFIKLVDSVEDIKKDEESGGIHDAFHPEFTHQIFGENENVFGYRNLKILLYYSSSRLSTYLCMKYSAKITSEVCKDVVADDVMKIIAEKIGGDFYFSLDEFVASLSKEHTFHPHGQLLHSLSVDDVVTTNGDKANGGDEVVKKRTFEVYKGDIAIEGFKEYHERMQTFLLWNIDAASYIDVDDDRWDYFVMYEKKNNTGASANGHVNATLATQCTYHFVGYATVYRYYAYINKIRPRISQFLILPPFQKKGLGAKLLQQVYDCYTKQEDVLDITVEDPSENFVRLRDFVDAKNCIKLNAFQADKLKCGWNDEMAKEASSKLKLNKKQVRRVYELLRFKVTDLSDKEEYRKYRLEVKNRLNAPYEKKKIDVNKLAKCGMLSSQEMETTLIPLEVRLDQLDKEYRELEEEYKHIIERLAVN